MLSIHQSPTLEEAGRELLGYILEPAQWVVLEGLRASPELPPGQNASYQRQVGALRICASVDVTGKLEVFLRVGFRAAGLSPMKAADHLEAFLRHVMPLRPNSEWQVQIDDRRWIHFIRRLVAPPLEA